MIAYFGADYDVQRLRQDSERRYERARAAGGLRYQHQRRVLRFWRVHIDTVVAVSQPIRLSEAFDSKRKRFQSPLHFDLALPDYNHLPSESY